ncbi:prepilin-type N-terminal cleavage/methylation domain-containing protein [Candidatus Neomarinimicrobiota bacterium]
MKNQKGFTLIELIVVIAIIAILAAVAVPAFINVVDEAHLANMDAVEGVFRSAAVMYASDQLLTTGTYNYPVTANATIALLTEDGAINDWEDGAAGVWEYHPGGSATAWGTLTYVGVPFAAGPPIVPSSYTIVSARL